MWLAGALGNFLCPLFWATPLDPTRLPWTLNCRAHHIFPDFSSYLAPCTKAWWAVNSSFYIQGPAWPGWVQGNAWRPPHHVILLLTLTHFRWPMPPGASCNLQGPIPFGIHGVIGPLVQHSSGVAWPGLASGHQSSQPWPQGRGVLGWGLACGKPLAPPPRIRG